MEHEVRLCADCGARLQVSDLFCPQCGKPRTGASRAALSPAADPLIGRAIIGQYVITQKMAEGGMGAVYLADQRSVGRQAVIKVMHPELSRDPSVAARFELEARAASLLNHPHIVTIYNYGAMEDGTLFLAMEYCRGTSLDASLSKGALGWERAARVVVQICDALAEAHRQGIVHRDLKPSNIMLVEAGRQHDFAKVLDFGIAKLDGTRLTRTGSIVGTPQYMSPEQFRGEKLDGRSDLYSLGIVLYEMIAGRLPFESENTAGFMHKHLEEPPPPISRRAPGLHVPRGVEAIVRCALAKQVSERFADADEMARALEKVIADPVQIPRTRVMRASRALHRGPLLGIAGGAVLAAAVTAGVTWLLRAPPTPPAPQSQPARWSEPVPASPVGSTGMQLASAHDAATPDASPIRRAESRGTSPASYRRLRAGRSGAAKRQSPAQAFNNDNSLTPAPVPASGRGQPSGSAESSGLLEAGPGKSPAELLSELKRLMSNARVPPSVLDTTLRTYSELQAKLPAGDRESRSRAYLAQLIVIYRNPSMQLSAAERLPLPRLRQIFLTMETKAPLTMDQRTQVLESALASYNAGERPEKDRVFYKRLTIVQLIKSYAVDPERALR